MKMSRVERELKKANRSENTIIVLKENGSIIGSNKLWEYVENRRLKNIVDIVTFETYIRSMEDYYEGQNKNYFNIYFFEENKFKEN